MMLCIPSTNPEAFSTAPPAPRAPTTTTLSKTDSSCARACALSPSSQAEMPSKTLPMICAAPRVSMIGLRQGTNMAATLSMVMPRSNQCSRLRKRTLASTSAVGTAMLRASDLSLTRWLASRDAHGCTGKAFSSTSR
ncbi:hypothetical protein D3C76_1357340 [compost metagenome]